MRLIELFRINEMARSREEAMWAVLDWAATQTGEFTIKDLHRIWVQAGGGGDNASYQQFSTAINNYIYKFDPQSPSEKYRNPRYKFIRVGKTDKGTVPAPLQFVTRGSRGAGAKHVLRWRPGIAPMRQPAAPKAPLAPEDSPIGSALDQLEKKMGRPALKKALEQWKQLGDLHKISAAIMGNSQIRGRDKMLALQVAADSLISNGKASEAEIDDAEEEMADDIADDSGRTPFSSQANDFEDDEKTDPDARPLGAQMGDDESDEGIPDNLFHDNEPEGDGPPSEKEDDEDSDTDEPSGEPTGLQPEDDETMRGTLVGTEEGGNEGTRIPVIIRYDDDDGASVEREGGDMIGPYEGFNLEVANGVLTQDAFDDLEEDGWNLVAAEEAQADDTESDSEEGDSGSDDSDEDDSPDESEEEPDDRGGTVRAGEFPAYVPEPDEQGDRGERSMFELVDEGGLDESSPLWNQLHGAKNSIDAHRIIKSSGLSPRLQRHALIVARAIFDNTGRDFDADGKNESQLRTLFGLIETPLVEPVDFDQESGLKRVFGWNRSR